MVGRLSATLARRWALRMLLLAVVGLGIAAMHTVGHGGMEAGAAHGHAAAAPHASLIGPAQPCHGMCADLSEACLFTMTTAGLLLVIALALSTLRTAAGRDRSGGFRGWPFPRRAPPLRWPIGLQLADLSVLRT